jgi:2-C-methyl-D-erythritol 2,4-cyclodiphosphate synthase
MKLRIGHGYDVHAFGDGKFVVLGGVRIAHDRGLIAHSDGDVVVHAVCDALLGAAALGDIGQHFPDTDPAYKNADSIMLLKHVQVLLHKQKFAVQNVDITVLAQRPKILPHAPLMRQNIAAALQLDVSCVGVKATTTEGLGFVGREEGIAAHAVVLLYGKEAE